MDKIKIWITVDENQMLADYSLAAKENYIEIEVTEEPKDYLNWGLRNGKLVHYPDDLNDLTNNRTTSFVGNVMLNFAVISWALSYIPLIGKIVLYYPKYTDIQYEYELLGLTDDNMETFVKFKRITEKQYKEITGKTYHENES
ncbi:XkdX family protein, partial [Pseudomonas aeruginosa]|nr:XkdX family protein [Pseudomonas aeruginosa]